jgi:hypothetical protein
MGNGGNGGSVVLPQEITDSLTQAATETAVATPTLAPSPLSTSQLAGGVSAIPIDAATWMQCQIAPNPTYGQVAAVSVTLTARILAPDGTITNCRWDNTFAPAAGLAFSSDLAPGYLISAALTLNTPGVMSGVLYALVGLVHQTPGVYPVDTLLIAQYLTSQNPVGWPCGILHDASEGPGYPLRFFDAVAAPTSSYTYTVQDWLFMLSSIGFYYDTDGTVSNRYVEVYAVTVAGGAATLAFSTFPEPALNGWSYYCSPGIGPAGDATTGNYVLPLSPGMLFHAGDQIIIGAIGLGAGDQVTNVSILANAWL